MTKSRLMSAHTYGTPVRIAPIQTRRRAAPQGGARNGATAAVTERREHPCSRCCEPLLRSRGAPAQHDLLVRVSILITCEYFELFLLSALTNGANCPNEQRSIENTRVNVGPVCVRAAASRRAATVTRSAPANVTRSCSPVSVRVHFLPTA